MGSVAIPSGGVSGYKDITTELLYNVTDNGTLKKYTFSNDYDLVLIIGGLQLGQDDSISFPGATVIIDARTELATREGYTYASNWSRVLLVRNVKAGNYYRTGYVRGIKVYSIIIS